MGLELSEIWTKWNELGGPEGFLGKSTTGETGTPDGIGHFVHFEHGSIYWKPSTCAHEVHGAIRGFWAKNGYERNASLGYPVSDEQPADPTNPANTNRFGDFENGVVYWRSATGTAMQLYRVDPSLIEVFTRTKAGSPGFDTSKEGIAALIKSQVESTPGITVEAGPTIDVDDYTCASEVTQGRRYRTRMWIKASGGCWPFSGWAKTMVEFVLAVDLDRVNRLIRVRLVSGETVGDASFSTWAGIAASSNQKAVDLRVADAVQKQKNSPLILPLPTKLDQQGKRRLNILAVKIAPTGELQIFAEPACLLLTAAAVAQGTGDADEALAVLEHFRDGAIAPLPRSAELIDRYYIWAPLLVDGIDSMPDAQEIFSNVYRELVVGAAERADSGELASLLEQSYPLLLQLVDAIERTNEPRDGYENVLTRVVEVLRHPNTLDALRQLLHELTAELGQS